MLTLVLTGREDQKRACLAEEGCLRGWFRDERYSDSSAPQVTRLQRGTRFIPWVKI